MNPKNPVTGINNFLNKNFGLPVPSSSSSFGIGGMSKPQAPAPNMTYAPSDTGATSPKPVAIVPPAKKSTLPVAGEKFVQDIYDATTGARTGYGASISAPDMLGGNPVIKGNETPVNPNGGASTGPVAPPKEPGSPYITYLRSMFDPEALKTASSNLTSANTRLADIQSQSEKKSLDGRHASEDAFYAVGGLKSGAIEASNAIGRSTNRELSDLAVQENAAARSAGISSGNYERIMGAGKSVYDAEQAQAKADQDITKTKQEQGYKDKVFDENKRQFGLEHALKIQEANKPKALTAAQEAKQIADEEKKTGAEQSATQTVGVINNLLSGDRYKAISGGTQTGMIPFFGDRAAVAEYKQLTGLLKLGIRGMIKGQGAVSDYEGKILSEASSALSRMTSEKQMKQALQKVRGVLKTNNGGDTQVIIRDSEGNTLGQGLLNGNDIYEAVNDGNTIEYL